MSGRGRRRAHRVPRLDDDDAHHPAARAFLSSALGRGDRLAMAASAMALCLASPARFGGPAVHVVHGVVPRLPLDVVPPDVVTATAAARLRAQHRSLRYPDALVIATAVEHGADVLATTNRGWPSSEALRFAVRIRQI